jgi:hypothetical protein
MTSRKLFTEIEQAQKTHNVILLNEFHPKMSVGIMSISGLFLKSYYFDHFGCAFKNGRAFSWFHTMSESKSLFLFCLAYQGKKDIVVFIEYSSLRDFGWSLGNRSIFI